MTKLINGDEILGIHHLEGNLKESISCNSNLSLENLVLLETRDKNVIIANCHNMWHALYDRGRLVLEEKNLINATLKSDIDTVSSVYMIGLETISESLKNRIVDSRDEEQEFLKDLNSVLDSKLDELYPKNNAIYFRNQVKDVIDKNNYKSIDVNTVIEKAKHYKPDFGSFEAFGRKPHIRSLKLYDSISTKYSDYSSIDEEFFFSLASTIKNSPYDLQYNLNIREFKEILSKTRMVNTLNIIDEDLGDFTPDYISDNKLSINVGINGEHYLFNNSFKAKPKQIEHIDFDAPKFNYKTFIQNGAKARYQNLIGTPKDTGAFKFLNETFSNRKAKSSDDDSNKDIDENYSIDTVQDIVQDTVKDVAKDTAKDTAKSTTKDSIELHNPNLLSKNSLKFSTDITPSSEMYFSSKVKSLPWKKWLYSPVIAMLGVGARIKNASVGTYNYVSRKLRNNNFNQRQENRKLRKDLEAKINSENIISQRFAKLNATLDNCLAEYETIETKPSENLDPHFNKIQDYFKQGYSPQIVSNKLSKENIQKSPDEIKTLLKGARNKGKKTRFSKIFLTEEMGKFVSDQYNNTDKTIYEIRKDFANKFNFTNLYGENRVSNYAIYTAKDTYEQNNYGYVSRKRGHKCPSIE